MSDLGLRKIDKILSNPTTPGPGAGGFSNFTKNLLSRRRPADPKSAPAPTKPTLSTTAQKEGEVKRVISTKWLPADLRLAKLRQMAAQGKILGPQARDFLNRSAQGKKLTTSESILKYEKELLTAVRQASAEKLKSPLKYEYRQGGEAKLQEQSKLMMKSLRRDIAEQSKDTGPKPDLMAERRARLGELYNRMRSAPPPAAAPAKIFGRGPVLGGMAAPFAGRVRTDLASPAPVSPINIGAADTSSPVGRPPTATTRALYIGKNFGPAEAAQIETDTGFHIDVAAPEQLLRQELTFDIYRLIMVEDLPSNPAGVHPINPNDLPSSSHSIIVVFSTNCPPDRHQDWIAAGAVDVRNETVTPEVARLIIIRLLGPSHVMTYDRPPSFHPPLGHPTSRPPSPGSVTPLPI